MNKKQNKATPVHRFYNAGQVHFKFVTITEASFEVPDVEHRHGYWTVFVFLEGKGRHVIDFKEVPIKPGRKCLKCSQSEILPKMKKTFLPACLR